MIFNNARVELIVSQYACLFFMLCGFLCFSCSEGKEIPIKNWSASLKGIGSFSSPRAIDLNGDSVKDIVLGAGKIEFQPTDSAVVALDGRTGHVLWTASARDQIFGSPLFLDITGDAVPEVIIGGRAAELMALDGSTGKVVWEYFPEGDTTDASEHQLYNFYNPQAVRDLDDDGVNDLLVSNGGYVKAPPGELNRPAGKLMLISGKTGILLAEAYMPDGKETYMSCVTFERNNETWVIYGSGGERIPGKLYLTTLAQIQQGSLENSVVLAESETKGFIAPPVLADITQDGFDDIVVNAVDGRTLAIDGESYETLWEFSLPDTEVYCSLAVGHFDQDDVPDFFTNYGIGVFPDLMRSAQVALSGADGSLVRIDSLGSFHYGSPVAYDMDGDGLDEVLFHVNEYIPGVAKNVLKMFDFAQDTVINFTPSANGANIAGTPLLDDLDHDGSLDIVIVHETNPFDLFSIDAKVGLAVKMIPTDHKLLKPIDWGSYMGSHYDGMYRAHTLIF
uniref:PQQ-binding-like beta-propeller repeat protein n=1 Tax=Roseihalotalea indica TaxID=2867963 RepID=A0AA49JG05_9BACT|nr:PQQ-binding-like beta-propeller repeat protein [Tunicatimonas sp. TK19036]